MQLRQRKPPVTHQARRSSRIAKETVRYTSPAGGFEDIDDSGLSELSAMPTPGPGLGLLNGQVSERPRSSSTPTSLLSRTPNRRPLLTRKRNNTHSASNCEKLGLGAQQRRAALLEDTDTLGINIKESIIETGKGINPTQQLDLAVPTASPLGLFDDLPREVRDMVYGYAMDVTKPSNPRHCCGIRATRRERNSCRKHGKKPRDSGRFNILLVSTIVAVEAGWVLHNFGKLELPIDNSIMPYLRNHVPKTRCRLGELPREERVKTMWLSVAQFRFVEIIFLHNLARDIETGGVGNIANACSLLLRARQDVQTKAHPTHIVTVNLGTLFEDGIPFVPEDHLSLVESDIYLMVMNSTLHQENYLEELPRRIGNTLTKVLSLIEQHRGCSQWKLAVGSDLDDGMEEAKYWLRTLEADCEAVNIEFLEL